MQVASQLVKLVVDRADNDLATVTALMKCCMLHNKGNLLEKESGELQKTQNPPTLVRCGC